MLANVQFSVMGMLAAVQSNVLGMLATVQSNVLGMLATFQSNVSVSFICFTRKTPFLIHLSFFCIFFLFFLIFPLWVFSLRLPNNHFCQPSGVKCVEL